MIRGTVDANLEARVPLYVEDQLGQTRSVDAVIDTGFTGFLSLPPIQIGTLGLQWLSKVQGMLANGSLVSVDIYRAAIIWDGQTRVVRVSAVDTAPLIGMKLLEGHDVWLRVIPGGFVHIDIVP